MNNTNNKYRLTLFILFVVQTLSSCALLPEYSDVPENNIILKSSYAIIELDNAVLVNTYQLAMPQGMHQIKVNYRTLLKDYHCVFEFSGESGQQFEIVDHFQASPIILYRLVRKNWFWHFRVDPVLPVECVQTER